jgi:hypothetical protein
MIHDLLRFKSPFDADEFIVSHRCASCWSRLERKTEQGEEGKQYTPVCEVCGEQTRGYVTAKYTERRIQSNQAEASEARHALREALPWMKINMKESQILESLGF